MKSFEIIEHLSAVILANQIWAHSPGHSEADVLTPGCSEGKCSIDHQAENPEQLVLKTSQLPKGFSKAFLKARWRGASQGVWSALYSLIQLVDGEVNKVGW